MLGEHIVPQSEAIRAILLDDSPGVLRGLTCKRSSARVHRSRLVVDWTAADCSSAGSSVGMSGSRRNCISVASLAGQIRSAPISLQGTQPEVIRAIRCAGIALNRNPS